MVDLPKSGSAPCPHLQLTAAGVLDGHHRGPVIRHSHHLTTHPSIHNMKKTSILNLKSWPKIHPPLPRTPRESQQLLSALTSSFRRQLDAAGNKPVQSTDRHLKSILDNPLFRVV